MTTVINKPQSLRQKKTERLQAIYEDMTKSGLVAVPSHLLETYLTVEDPQLNGRSFKISMDNLELVKVVAVYHQYQYDETLEDRRNAIKTARDIFEFYHDIQVGDFSKMSKTLQGVKVPKLSLYYQNNPTNNSVLVTATARHSYTDFLFNSSEILTDLNDRLNTLTRTIAMDVEGEGKELRWEKEVSIAKAWWKH